jgi:serine/threonine-protein kinase
LLEKNAQIFNVTDSGGSNRCPGQCVLSLSESATLLMTQGAFEDARHKLALSNAAALALHAQASERYGASLVIGARLDALQGHTAKAAEDLRRIVATWPATVQDLPQPYVLATLAQIEISLQTNLHADAVSQAQALLERILALPDRSYFADWEARAQRVAGVALAQNGQVTEAEAHLRRALELRRLIDVEDSPWLAEARISLAEVLIAANKLPEARSLLSQAADAQSKQPTLGEQYRQPLRLAQARLTRAQP